MQQQEALIASLSAQPILVVVRPDQADLDGDDGPGSLLDHLSCLDEVGLRHVEIGWQPDGRWCSFVARVRQRCPSLQLGAASLLTADALADLETCGLPFAMSPCFDPALLERARQRGILLARLLLVIPLIALAVSAVTPLIFLSSLLAVFRGFRGLAAV